ncbi:MAG: EF-hand domain-containing protein [Candidatus Margulisbacteria bacterium]|nr:EF-hand domain-containing protein [Candidatus Margulisiibacteriota bacterium]
MANPIQSDSLKYVKSNMALVQKFKEMDKNGDGKIDKSEAEKAGMAKEFDAVAAKDGNSDSISLSDLESTINEDSVSISRPKIFTAAELASAQNLTAEGTKNFLRNAKVNPDGSLTVNGRQYDQKGLLLQPDGKVKSGNLTQNLIDKKEIKIGDYKLDPSDFERDGASWATVEYDAAGKATAIKAKNENIPFEVKISNATYQVSHLRVTPGNWTEIKLAKETTVELDGKNTRVPAEAKLVFRAPERKNPPTLARINEIPVGESVEIGGARYAEGVAVYSNGQVERGRLYSDHDFGNNISRPAGSVVAFNQAGQLNAAPSPQAIAQNAPIAPLPPETKPDEQGPGIVANLRDENLYKDSGVKSNGIVTGGLLKDTIIIETGDQYIELPQGSYVALRPNDNPAYVVFSRDGKVILDGKSVAVKNGDYVNFSNDGKTAHVLSPDTITEAYAAREAKENKSVEIAQNKPSTVGTEPPKPEPKTPAKTAAPAGRPKLPEGLRVVSKTNSIISYAPGQDIYVYIGGDPIGLQTDGAKVKTNNKGEIEWIQFDNGLTLGLEENIIIPAKGVMVFDQDGSFTIEKQSRLNESQAAPKPPAKPAPKPKDSNPPKPTPPSDGLIAGNKPNPAPKAQPKYEVRVGSNKYTLPAGTTKEGDVYTLGGRIKINGVDCEKGDKLAANKEGTVITKDNREYVSVASAEVIVGSQPKPAEKTAAPTPPKPKNDKSATAMAANTASHKPAATKPSNNPAHRPVPGIGGTTDIIEPQKSREELASTIQSAIHNSLPGDGEEYNVTVSYQIYVDNKIRNIGVKITKNNQPVGDSSVVLAVKSLIESKVADINVPNRITLGNIPQETCVYKGKGPAPVTQSTANQATDRPYTLTDIDGEIRRSLQKYCSSAGTSIPAGTTIPYTVTYDKASKKSSIVIDYNNITTSSSGNRPDIINRIKTGLKDIPSSLAKFDGRPLTVEKRYEGQHRPVKEEADNGALPQLNLGITADIRPPATN